MGDMGLVSYIQGTPSSSSLEISPDPPLEPSSKGSPQRHFFQSSDLSSPSDNTGHCDTHLPSLSGHWESRDKLDRVWNI